MKISTNGLSRIKARSELILTKLNLYASMKKLNREQREDFKDLQTELESTRRVYEVFTNPDLEL